MAFAVTLSASAATVTGDGSITATVTVTNGGADPTTGNGYCVISNAAQNSDGSSYPVWIVTGATFNAAATTAGAIRTGNSIQTNSKPAVGSPFVFTITLTPNVAISGANSLSASFAGTASSASTITVSAPRTIPQDVLQVAWTPTSLSIPARGILNLNIRTGWGGYYSNLNHSGFSLVQRTPGGVNPINPEQLQFASDGTAVLSFQANVGVVGEKRIEFTYRYAIANYPGGGLSWRSERYYTDVTIAADPALSAPDAPSGLSATANGYTKISLAWTDNSDFEAGVRVHRALDSSGPYIVVATLPADSVSYTDTQLAAGTAYHYKVGSFNGFGDSALSSSATATTVALPAVPTAPTSPSATALNSSTVILSWTDASSDEDGFVVFSSSVSGGPYAEVGRVGSGVTNFFHTGLPASTVTYYKIAAFNAGGNSTLTSEVTATTLPKETTQATTSGFTIDTRAKITLIQVGGRLMVWNDYDRPLVFINRRWYKAGVKPLLTAAVISDGGAAGSGLGVTGNITAYIVLKRSDGVVRSVYNLVSNTLTGMVNRRITIVPPLNAAGTKVAIRDTGYDTDGTVIDGADRWEIYLYEENLDVPVLVADLPITTLTYTTPTSLRTEDLNALIRRPMELLRESQLPPACSFAAYHASRVHAFGEVTLKPSSDEVAAGATLTITTGQTSCTIFASYTPTDGLIGKELTLNKSGTGWFCSDVEGQTVYLFHPDKAVQDTGFQGASGTYIDWAFDGRKSRVYRSAYFAGEAGGNVSFSPETFPPFNYLESELDPDDNQDPVGAISARDVLFLAKRSKWFYLEGGTGLDNDPSGAGFPRVVKVSSTSGLLAPKTLCVDEYDNVYYLGPEGVMLLTQSGVQRVGDIAGAAFLLKNFFDVRSASQAVGEYFPREGWFVVGGLDRISATDKRSGVIYDTKTRRVWPWDFPRRVTALKAVSSDDGDSQLYYGDEIGRAGVLFQKGVYTDEINYLSSTPYASEVPPTHYTRTGVMTNNKGLTVRTVKPSLKITPNTSALTWTIAVDAEPQTGDPSEFTTTVSCSHKTDDSRPWYPMERWQTQAAALKLSITPSRSTSVRMSGLEIEIDEPRSAQTQGDSA